MAEALISILLQQLASVALQKVKEWKLVEGIHKEVEKLGSNLKAIQAVLLDAERRQVTEAAVRDWLEKLKDVSYDIDHVSDEWITAILMLKFKREEGDNALSAKKVCFFVPSVLCFHCSHGQLQQAVDPRPRCNIACKIEELNERLDPITLERNRYNFNAMNISDMPERQKTTSFVDVSQVHGRDKEKKILISKLLCKSSQRGRELNVIPIVGMGGIGKTTLCQLAYNDHNVKAHFEKRNCVCVSDPFDEIRITKAIIEAPEDVMRSLVEMQSLLKRLCKSIKGKRFLLNLYDVWNEDATKWEPIKEALKNGAAGSRIIVTTRKNEVAIMMKAEIHMVSVEALSEECCWSIFSQIAFFGRDRYEQIEEIGKKISIKCKGVPLVAKTLGSLMRFKKGMQQWKDFLHGELWEIEDVKIKVFAPFLLSYDDLAPIERWWLLYCSIFPKDYEIEKTI